MTGLQTVLLPVGDDLYAVPVNWVREVVVASTLSPLVTAPPNVLGLFNLRGQIVPLFDTAALLGLGAAAPATFALVLQSPHGLFGLAATAIPRRAVLSTFTGPSELPGTAGTYQLERQVVVLLDPDVLLVSKGLVGAGGRTGAVLSGVG
jgi:purine-binding chemotaxis protein CheW